MLIFVLLGAPGLRERLRPTLLPPLRPPLGSSIRSKRLRLGLTAVSNGLRVGAARPRMPMPLVPADPEGPDGRSVRRIGWPFAFAPSNSRIA